MYTCLQCGESFEEDAIITDCEEVFCSEECVHEYGYEECSECGEYRTIEIGTSSRQFCSSECANNAGYELCDSCETWNKNSIHDIQGNSYCSYSCASNEGAYECEQCNELSRNTVSAGEQIFCSSECRAAAGYHYCDECEEYTNDCDHHIEERDPEYRRTEEGKPTFGIEVEIGEFYPSKEEVNADTPSSWGWHPDGSTVSGWEAVSPILHLEEVIIPKALQKCKVTKKEGTHLHIGNFISDKHAFRFWMLCIECENHFVRMCPPSRWENTYCKKQHRVEVKIMTGNKMYIRNTDRYMATNNCSLSEHGTIEIRCHGGTTETRKMYNWASMFAQIWEFAKNPNNPMPNWCCVSKWIQFFTPETQAYIAERINKFDYKYIEKNTCRHYQGQTSKTYKIEFNGMTKIINCFDMWKIAGSIEERDKLFNPKQMEVSI